MAVAIMAGGLSALALPPYFFAPILLVTLPALVILMDGADADPRDGLPFWHRRRLFGPFFGVGWGFGFGYFLAGLYWVAEALLVNASAHAWLIPFAVVLLPAGLAFFVAIPCTVAGWLWGTGFARIGVLASLLCLGEYMRNHVLTGFPWNGFHSALGMHDILLQGFSLVGPTGASLLVLIVAMAPAGLWPRTFVGGGSKAAVALCFLTLACWGAFGAYRLDSTEISVVDGTQFRIVQPNISQQDKWDPALREQNFATLIDLTRGDGQNGALGLLGASHIVWPESAFPFLLSQRPDALAAIGQTLPLGVQLLAGAIRAEPRGATQVFYNAVFAFNDRGEITNAYDKVRLVPFGETLPFSSLIDRLGIRPLVSAPAGFVAGNSLREFAGSGPVALPLVCYEVIFSDFVRKGARDHTVDYILNVTNDAWFGASNGPHQHFFQTRLRAVELGLPVVRSANTGISGIIDGFGRIQSLLDLGARGVVDGALPAPLETTLYREWGQTVFWSIIALILGLSIYNQRVQKPKFT